jgi:hypothetical protein
MKKNDKLVVLFGVIILVISSIGVYLWVPESVEASAVAIEDVLNISSHYSREVVAVTVSDSCPFFPLIATPITLRYDPDGMQHLRPLYVKNSEEVSRAVTRVESQIGIPVDEFIDDSDSPKNWSLYLAEKYWESSEGVLLIQYNETGYNLGVVATPLASYLGIPVIVTDEVDAEVTTVLIDLGVKISLVCGDLEGYGEILKFNNVEEIIDLSITEVKKKFDDVKYITLTNPRDAWPPEVLNESYLEEEIQGTVKSSNQFPSHIIDTIRDNRIVHYFNIPKDYKYALVKIDFRNFMNPENIEKFGDDIMIQGSISAYTGTTASPVKRDEHGNVEYDQFLFKEVFYDSGGEEHNVKVNANFHVDKSAEYSLNITFQNLSDPYYPMMPQFSSLAPYLTAYHKGIIFAKPEFAFAADDDKLLDGKTLPGPISVKFNWQLIPVINRHIYDNIHLPLNDILSHIRNISDNRELWKNCQKFPFNIAIVGGTVMVPQYYYRSPHNDPFDHPDAIYGTGCPSDFIYGNIDPETYFMQPHNGPEDVENDLYSYYPEAENVVGRITGWDVQDASALIARTIFYDYLINNIDNNWKDNAAVMTGAGAEVQKFPILNSFMKIRGKDPLMKFPSGEKRFMVKGIADRLELGGFNVETAERGRAMKVGYSKEALGAINRDGILNRLLFPKWLVQIVQGFENIESLRDLQWWREALSDGSGIRGGEIQESSNLIMSDSHAIWFNIEHGDCMMHYLGGPPILYQILARLGIYGIRTPLDKIGSYNVRSVESMDMGPSIMMIEGCGSGKIDSLPPTNTIANTYLHAGINSYISPTTYSAFYGILEPRPAWSLLPIDAGVGFGLIGYIKAWFNALRGSYPPVHFSQVIFEKTYQGLIESNYTIGRALRDGKNAFLPSDANKTYFWNPPLSDSEDIKTTGGAGDRVILEKYCAVYQLNLLGDPAFNPYEPCNEGRFQ